MLYPETIIIIIIIFIIFVIFRFLFLNNFILCDIYFFLNQLRFLANGIFDNLFQRFDYRLKVSPALCLHLFYRFSKRELLFMD